MSDCCCSPLGPSGGGGTDLGTVPDWYINAATGSDSNDGKTALTPFKTMEHLNELLWPNGDFLTIQQDVNVHLAAGPGSTPATYGVARPRVRNPIGFHFFFSYLAEITSTAAFGATTFTNSAPTVPTRGEVVSAGATFVNNARLRSTTGVNAGSLAYSTGLNGGVTDTFVTEWVDVNGNMVNLTNGDNVVVDTLLVTVSSFDAVFNNYADGGGLFIQDCIVGDAGGATYNVSSDSLRDGVFFYGCQFTSDTTAESVGNATFVGCCWKGSANFGAGFWRFGGSCAFQQLAAATERILFDHNANVQFQGGNACNGMRLAFVRGVFVEFQRSVSALESLEFENGAGVAAGLDFQQGTWWYATNYPFWGVTGNFTVGIKMTGPSLGSFAQAAPTLSIPSATNVTLNGQSFTFAQLPQRVGSCVIDNTALESLDSVTIHLTAQAAAKALTNMFASNPPAGLYLVMVGIEITTAGTAGTITPNAASKGDGAAARTQSGNTSGLITVLGASSYSFLCRCDGASNVQYGTTFVGVTVGGLQYSINASAKRVGN